MLKNIQDSIKEIKAKLEDPYMIIMNQHDYFLIINGLSLKEEKEILEYGKSLFGLKLIIIPKYLEDDFIKKAQALVLSKNAYEKIKELI